MNQMDLIRVAAANPGSVRPGDTSYWTQVIGSILPSVLAFVSQAYDWDFLLKDYATVSTVSGTSEYTLTGESKDLRDIVAIRYGSSSKVLQKFRRLDAFDALQGGANFGGVKAWYQSGISTAGYPTIKLMDTPGSVNTLSILYRQKNVDLSEFPEDFMWVLSAGIDAFVDPRNRIIFIDSLRRMVKRHKVGGKDYHPYQADPLHIRHNNDMWDLYNLG